MLGVYGLFYGIVNYGPGWLFWELLPSFILVGLLYFAYRLTMKDRGYGHGSGRSRTKVKPSQKTMAKVAGVRKTQAAPGKRKTYPFQVIEGSKGKNDDQLPKYH